METLTVTAPAIECDGCARSIMRSLGGVPGVQTVEVDVPGKRVTVEYDSAQTSPSAIRTRLDRAGFPTDD